MRLTKTKLKAIIKECLTEMLEEDDDPIRERLVEILEDGVRLNPSTKRQRRVFEGYIPAPIVYPQPMLPQQPMQHAPSHTQVNWHSQQAPPQVQRQKPVINEAVIKEHVAMATDDPILQGIFEDTAKSTYLEQQRGESLVGAAGDGAARRMAEVDPTMLVGANNWESLAFVPPRNAPPGTY